jgi:hypothetical protein
MKKMKTKSQSLITKLLPPGYELSKEFRLIIPYNFEIELYHTLDNIFVVRNLLNVYTKEK